MSWLHRAKQSYARVDGTGESSGFRVPGSGFRVVEDRGADLGSEFRVSDSGCRDFAHAPIAKTSPLKAYRVRWQERSGDSALCLATQDPKQRCVALAAALHTAFCGACARLRPGGISMDKVGGTWRGLAGQSAPWPDLLQIFRSAKMGEKSSLGGATYGRKHLPPITYGFVWAGRRQLPKLRFKSSGTAARLPNL